MDHPAVILTSQFEAQNVYADYIDYQTRANALAKKPDRTALEETELTRITKALFADKKYQQEPLISEPKAGTKRSEAQELMSHFDENFQRYLSYMTRMQALRQKENRTEKEDQELERVSQGIAEINVAPVEKNGKEKPLYGAFTANKDEITSGDRVWLKEKYRSAEKHGSVLYKDVVSFDTKFLEKIGVYNAATDDLDEKPLMRAGRAMMNEMIRDEHLENVTWLGTIHRNTGHIHIHFSAVEAYNTRPLVTRKNKEGQDYLTPNATRKQATLNQMKATFAETLVDRAKERQRIGQMRDYLINDVRESLPGHSMALAGLQRVVARLPNDRRKWQYGSINAKTQRMMDGFIDYFMDATPRFHEYHQAVQKSESVDRELFGETKQKHLHYATNQMADLHKRLGNQVLHYIKDMDQRQRRVNPTLAKVPLSDRYLEELAAALEEEKKREQAPMSPEERAAMMKKKEAESRPRPVSTRRPLILRRDLYALKRELSHTMEEEKYRALREHEKTQRAVDWDRERE